MPRRDVVLTGIIAFAAGCAVGANWPKIRKKIGPMVGKAGFQISELGEFLSEAMPDTESFFNAAAGGRGGADSEVNGSNGVHKHTNGRVNPKTGTTARKRTTVRRKKVASQVA